MIFEHHSSLNAIMMKSLVILAILAILRVLSSVNAKTL